MRKFRPGLSFSDFVQRGGKVWKFRAEEQRDYRRGWLVWLGVVVVFGVLGVRLTGLTVFSGGKYRVLADENRISRIRLPAPRGKILDRNGVELLRDEATAHVVGYVGEVSEDEVGLLKEKGAKYTPGSLIGRSGIEAQYEETLRGVDGGRLVEVDNVGEAARELGRREPVAGTDLRLSIDAGLQEIAYKSLNGQKGAAAVSDPRTGEILALVSSPSFDPNEISTKYEVLSAKADLPFFNRAIGGVYAPGSTFKIVTTTAALESGNVEPDFVFEDRGVITVGSFSYTNWLFTKRGGIEGVVGFDRALTRSTDTFFYKVGELTGPEIIVEWAKKMGLGEKTGIDLPGEVAGLVPDPTAGSGQGWYLGNTYHLAIGQEDLLATPLQINVMTNIIASNVKKCKPGLVNTALSSPPPKLGGGSKGEVCSEVKISSETLEIIKKGMVGACSTGGTSFVMFDWNASESFPKIACKTGTAEYVAQNGRIKTHAWLTAFAPADNPVISATVVFEGGGEGSNVAAPAVRKIFAKYFGVEDTYPYGAIRGEGE